MKRLLVLILFLFNITIVNGLNSKIEELNNPAYNPFNPNLQQNRIYYGGNLTFRFWNKYLYIGVSPYAGYKITPKLSVGSKINYAFVSDSRFDPTLTSHNFGGSVFSRYRIVPQFYLHGEFVYFSFEGHTYNTTTRQYDSDRVWVPFLLLGGGISHMVSTNVWVFVEVLVDVLNDENSPYEKWDPFVNVGVGVGF